MGNDQIGDTITTKELLKKCKTMCLRIRKRTCSDWMSE